MRQITMMSGRTFIISADEAENVKKVLFSNTTKFIELRSGDMINSASIESVGKPETKAFYKGDRMSKDLTKVFVGGEWKMFAGNKSDIEFRAQKNEAKRLN